MKKYYAESCRWGVNISYESMGGGAFDFYAFDSKAARDSWVEDHEWDGYPNRTAGTSTRKAVEHCCGKDFPSSKQTRGCGCAAARGLNTSPKWSLKTSTKLMGS